MEKIINVVAIITFPLLPLLLVTDIVGFNEKFYEQKFQERGIYDTINASREEINLQAENILAYIQSEAPLTGNLLNKKEEQHLADVQGLVTRGQQLLMLLVFLQIGIWTKIREKKKVLLYGSILTLLCLGIFSIISFEQLFLQFHYIFFTNDFWLLNPATDNLIKMYPQEIFHDVVKASMVQTTGIAGMLLVVSMLHRWKRN